MENDDHIPLRDERGKFLDWVSISKTDFENLKKDLGELITPLEFYERHPSLTKKFWDIRRKAGQAPRVVKLKPHSSNAHMGIDTLTGENEPFTVEPVDIDGATHWKGSYPSEPLLTHAFKFEELEFLGQSVDL